jgi:hypothetical protein
MTLEMIKIGGKWRTLESASIRHVTPGSLRFLPPHSDVKANSCTKQQAHRPPLPLQSYGCCNALGNICYGQFFVCQTVPCLSSFSGGGHTGGVSGVGMGVLVPLVLGFGRRFVDGDGEV